MAQGEVIKRQILSINYLQPSTKTIKDILYHLEIQSDIIV